MAEKDWENTSILITAISSIEQFCCKNKPFPMSVELGLYNRSGNPTLLLHAAKYAVLGRQAVHVWGDIDISVRNTLVKPGEHIHTFHLLYTYAALFLSSSFYFR
jgi:hypothetical protein